MSAAYRHHLERIRQLFPQPVSDRVHDSYMVHSIMRALDQVDELKSELPILGRPGPIDFKAALDSALEFRGSTLEEVTRLLVSHLEGITIFGHPCTQQNVITQPTIPSIIGMLLASLYNPNLVWDDSSSKVALAEVEVAAMSARLVGYDPALAAGVFTFGGTGTTLYGAKIGLEKACPQTMQHGLRQPAVILASDTSHYCRYSVAGWLGLGADNLITAPTTNANEIDIGQLAQACRKALNEGRPIAAFIVTLGTTDAFGLDDLRSCGCPARRAGARVSVAVPAARPRRRRHRLGLVGLQRLRRRGQSARISPAHAARPGRAPPGASATCTWRIRSASISTRPASRPIFPVFFWSRTARS